jgi:hypothetical protein
MIDGVSFFANDRRHFVPPGPLAGTLAAVRVADLSRSSVR